MTRITLVAAFAAMMPLAALAQGEAAPQITVTDAHVFSANPMTAAAMLTLHNAGDSDCTLTAVSGDVAAQIALHRNVETDGIMKMEPIEGGITVPAGGEAQLGPDGSHIMLMGVTRPLAPGDSVEMDLDLGTCGTVPVTAEVVGLPGHAGGAAGGDHGTMDHGASDHDATGRDDAGHGNAGHDNTGHDATDHDAGHGDDDDDAG